MGPAHTRVRRDRLKLISVLGSLERIGSAQDLIPQAPREQIGKGTLMGTGTSQRLGQAGREELPRAAGAISHAEDTERGQSPSA